MGADRWTGRVTLDGVDVSNRCWAVLTRGETPVAVVLFRRDATGRVLYDPVCRSLAREVRVGVIECTLRLRAEEPPLTLNGALG
jgi:hypothetical protein